MPSGATFRPRLAEQSSLTVQQQIVSPSPPLAAFQVAVPPLRLTGVADGTCTTSARIMHVKPEVSVTVADGRVTSIACSQSVASNISPMIDRIIAAQSPDVDGISGATITTKAFKAAVSDAVTP